jgi:hypothetical protein
MDTAWVTAAAREMAGVTVRERIGNCHPSILASGQFRDEKCCRILYAENVIPPPSAAGNRPFDVQIKHRTL